jgi:4-diphosphocytidyl-2C-methyl-D-erythritol kinase
VRSAHAKVNLWLNVVGRRGDGYHLLDSLVAFVDLADTPSRPGLPTDCRSNSTDRARPTSPVKPIIWC